MIESIPLNNHTFARVGMSLIAGLAFFFPDYLEEYHYSRKETNRIYFSDEQDAQNFFTMLFGEEVAFIDLKRYTPQQRWDMGGLLRNEEFELYSDSTYGMTVLVIPKQAALELKLSV